MTRPLLEIILLFVGVGIMLLSCLGVLTMRGVYNKTHYLGPASTLGPLAIVAALLLATTKFADGLKLGVIFLSITLISPVVSHATMQAARTRDYGDLEIRPEEKE